MNSESHTKHEPNGDSTRDLEGKRLFVYLFAHHKKINEINATGTLPTLDPFFQHSTRQKYDVTTWSPYTQRLGYWGSGSMPPLLPCPEQYRIVRQGRIGPRGHKRSKVGP